MPTDNKTNLRIIQVSQEEWMSQLLLAIWRQFDIRDIEKDDGK